VRNGKTKSATHSEPMQTIASGTKIF